MLTSSDHGGLPESAGVCKVGCARWFKNPGELFEYLPILVENDANYVNDAHGNVIFRLENSWP
jgi:hypothetical protein